MEVEPFHRPCGKPKIMAVRKKKNARKKRATPRTLAAFDVQAHLSATPYDLRIFDADAVRRLEVSERNGKAYIRCLVRQRDYLVHRLL